MIFSKPDSQTFPFLVDTLGELTRQADAKGQRTCLYYDSLGRLLGKHYRADNDCPTSPTYTVSYSYDAGTNGIGRRTGMTDASGSSAWSYDPRGRVIQESKVITGSGTFVTQYGNNSADRVSWMKYPANNSGGTGDQRRGQ